ncbi:MAG: hypothetical protein L6V93_17145 [Clostridiales bacterium]|nr:MAG: hypothetical protein L6V93_17145 [Clostridiales bacterium]
MYSFEKNRPPNTSRCSSFTKYANWRTFFKNMTRKNKHSYREHQGRKRKTAHRGIKRAVGAD